MKNTQRPTLNAQRPMNLLVIVVMLMLVIGVEFMVFRFMKTRRGVSRSAYADASASD